MNDQTTNQATIHTSAGCTIPSTNAAVGATGRMVNGFNCDVAATSNAGCGTIVDDTATYGPGFNAAGGGVYAMLWDSTAISVWFFPRADVPADIAARAPQPAGWGTPFARWPGTSCDTMSFFTDHNAIFDTTLWCAARFFTCRGAVLTSVRALQRRLGRQYLAADLRRQDGRRDLRTVRPAARRRVRRRL